jgi:hypothetical protein
MKRLASRSFCLGVQWDAASWETVLPWCEYLFDKLKGQRLHWNLPAFPSEGPARRRAAVAKALRARIEENGDVVSSAGFAGACHPLLNLDELEKELGWGLKNPWGTGITDVLGMKPDILVPPVPDLVRPQAWAMYRDHGFTRIGIRGCGPGQLPGLDGAFSYGLLPLAAPAREDAARLLRRLSADGGPTVLILDLGGLASLGPLERAVTEIASLLPPAESRGLPLISELPPPARRPGRPGARVPMPPAAVLRARIGAAEALSRKKRKKTEEYRDLLRLLGPNPSPVAPRPAPDASPQGSAQLVAHMLGEVSLGGDQFDVCLSGGRFCGIGRRGVDFLPRRPALSALVIDGRPRAYRTQSSFSFEGENGTGLREELTLEGGDGGTLRLEYSFREGSPLLSVTGRVAWPRLEGARVVDEHAPFAIALTEAARDGTVEVKVSAPDESLFSVPVDEGTGPVLVPGSAYRVRLSTGGRLLLRFAAKDCRTWGLAWFRVARVRGKRFLEFNPFGSYAPVPAAALGGTVESFSLFIGLDAD